MNYIDEYNVPDLKFNVRYFEQNSIASQLLWYYNSGLHRFSDIDNLPSEVAVNNLVNEIESEVPTFKEKNIW